MACELLAKPLCGLVLPVGMLVTFLILGCFACLSSRAARAPSSRGPAFSSPAFKIARLVNEDGRLCPPSRLRIVQRKQSGARSGPTHGGGLMVPFYGVPPRTATARSTQPHVPEGNSFSSAASRNKGSMLVRVSVLHCGIKRR